MKDRVNGLAAGSPDTVVVLAKGIFSSLLLEHLFLASSINPSPLHLIAPMKC